MKSKINSVELILMRIDFYDLRIYIIIRMESWDNILFLHEINKENIYVSPYLVANQGGRYTKHIYIGSQRVVSKIGDFDSYGSDPRRIQYAGSETDGLSVNYKVKYAQQLQAIKDNYATFR